jgi:hypothetical protein
MKRIYRWDDAPHPVATRHICYADSTADVPTNIGEIFQGGPNALEPIIGPPSGGFLSGIGSILQTVAPIVLPILETAIGQPELILPTEGAFAALNAGEGIAQQKPFGDIALGLGESAAGAALGGQFGDLGLGDVFGGSSFFGGGGAVDPLAATGDAAAQGAVDQFGGVPVSGADVLGGISANPFSGITAADFGIDPTQAITGQTGATGFADALQSAAASGSPITSANVAQLGPAAEAAGAPTGSDVFGNPVPTNQVNLGSDVFGNEIIGIGPAPADAGVGAGTGLAPDAGLPPPVIPDFSAPPVTPDIPAPAPAPPAPDLTPVPTDTGVLGTSPVMEPPGMGIAPPPASVDVAAPGVGTATPGAAAGTGGAATGLTPAGALDPFGLGGTGTAAGAPGIGGGDVGLPTPDSSVSIPQGDATGGVGVPGGSPATQLGFDTSSIGVDDTTGTTSPADPTGSLGGGAPGSPVDPTNIGTQIAQAPPADPTQAVPGTGGGDGLPQWLTDYINAQSPTGAIPGGQALGGGAPAGGGIPGAMIASANPADNPAAVAAAAAGGTQTVTPTGGGFDVSSLLKYLGPALGIGGLAKQLLAPGLSLAPGQGTNTAALTAAQQALIDELAALRQSTLTPAAQQGSTALTQATSTAQQYANQLLSGKLTPEQSQLVANNLAATLSTIKSRYGSLGQGTSTSEMEDEAAATAASVGGAGALQQQNTSQGIQLEQLASSDAQASVQELLTAAGVQGNQTNTLLQQQEAQDAQLSQMIARLAAALGGTPPTYTLQPTA